MCTMGSFADDTRGSSNLRRLHPFQEKLLHFHVISYESENNVEHQKVSGAPSCAYYIIYTQNSPFPYSLGVVPIYYFKNSAAIYD